MSENVVTINNLVKYYDGRHILKDINLTIPQGCVYGLLGRNGAGKTTIIRILMGLESPTRGSTTLLGAPSHELTPAHRARVGYVAEGHHLIQNYRVSRIVDLYRSLARQWDQSFFQSLIDMFRLPMDRKVKELSNGMRAQLNLALAMAIKPEVLILDDPTLGLDTIARRQFLELAIDLIQQDGRTILFSSHILSDVERVADRIGILTAGKLVVDCDLEQLKKRVKKLRVIFPDAAPHDLHLTEIIQQQITGREMILTVANWNQRKQALLNTYHPETCDEITLTLEDLFIECTQPR